MFQIDIYPVAGFVLGGLLLGLLCALGVDVSREIAVETDQGAGQGGNMLAAVIKIVNN